MKICVTIRFYEELNDYLSAGTRKQDRTVEIETGTSVKELIESMGPPCAAVDLILVNSQSEDFNYVLQDHDRISVYPVFERFNVESVTVLEQSPLRNIKFICDVHLGRLAKFLRMLGFDTLYKNDYNDNTLIRLSNTENRILLSRDTTLLMNKKITRRYRITQTDPDLQLREVVSYFDLKNNIMPMSRCLECNGAVQPVSKETVTEKVKPAVYKINDAFTRCMQCGKVFWKGSHYDSMIKRIHDAAR